MSCRGITCILDLDGTLTSTPHKAHGKYLPLTESPCLEPVIKYLEADGRLAVVSTAGKRMWRQFFEPVQATLQHLYKRDASFVGRIIFGSYTSAVIYYSDGPEQKLVEDVSYRLEFKTTMDPAKVPAVLDLLRSVIIKIFDTMARDKTYLPALSKKYSGVFGELLKRREELGAEQFNAEVLTMENVLKHGKYLVETHDALLDSQYVVGQESNNIIAHLNILGVPMARFGDIFPPELCDMLAKDFGVSARAQPNSVAIAVDGLDKGTFMRFVLANCNNDKKAYLKGVNPNATFSGGDIPQSVDAPLAMYPPVRFVSVCTKLLTAEERAQLAAPIVEIGGEEDGTAKFLATLVHNADEWKSSMMTSEQIVAKTFQQLKSAPFSGAAAASVSKH